MSVVCVWCMFVCTPSSLSNMYTPCRRAVSTSDCGSSSRPHSILSTPPCPSPPCAAYRAPAASTTTSGRRHRCCASLRITCSGYTIAPMCGTPTCFRYPLRWYTRPCRLSHWTITGGLTSSISHRTIIGYSDRYSISHTKRRGGGGAYMKSSY